ncbi:hypothetical protein D3C71_2137660 [compost metagenome]
MHNGPFRRIGGGIPVQIERLTFVGGVILLIFILDGRRIAILIEITFAQLSLANEVVDQRDRGRACHPPICR